MKYTLFSNFTLDLFLEGAYLWKFEKINIFLLLFFYLEKE